MKCKNCDHGALIYAIPHTENITRDMAIDAGYPEMEGMEWDFGTEWVQEPCPCCNGGEFYENCPNCKEQS